MMEVPQRTEDPQTDYLAYLLRLWWMSGEGAAGWRASLARPGSDERHGFANLDNLREDDKLRALVREAEVVTVWTGGMRAKSAYTGKGMSCDRLLEVGQSHLTISAVLFPKIGAKIGRRWGTCPALSMSSEP